jgi:hypothetical protein
MTMRCALCGRLTPQPAVLIGTMPVGPKCARRAGLYEAVKRPGSLVNVAPTYTRRPKEACPVTMDLFEAHA